MQYKVLFADRTWRSHGCEFAIRSLVLATARGCFERRASKSGSCIDNASQSGAANCVRRRTDLQCSVANVMPGLTRLCLARASLRASRVIAGFRRRPSAPLGPEIRWRTFWCSSNYHLNLPRGLLRASLGLFDTGAECSMR